MQVVVIGAGVAGLTAAYLLACQGVEVAVIEREETVGGLARSFRYGEYTFDVGPHRFHTDYAPVADLIREVLGTQITTIDRSSSVWLFGRHHPWPLRPMSLFFLPPSVSLRICGDVLGPKRTKEGSSFQDYILSVYGPTIYEAFFHPYTGKFLKLPPELIDEMWARVSIQRAVIDNRLKMTTLNDLIKATLFYRRKLKFWYPVSGGIGRFSLNLAERIRALGGSVYLGTPIQKIEFSEERIQTLSTDQRDWKPDLVVWTAPLTTLTRQLGMPVPKLEYLSTVLYNLEVIGPPQQATQWCYFGGNDTIFSRVSVPVHFCQTNAPPGKHGLCVEVTASIADEVWNQPEKLIEPVLRDLVKTKVLKSKEDVENIHVERIPHTYPIYALGYKAELHSAMSRLQNISNLHLLGRTACFWYNNMDHSMAMAMTLVKKLKEQVRAPSESTF